MKEKYFNFIMPFIWFTLLVFCVFLFAFTSHADSSYFPMNQNDNNNIPESYYSIFDTYLDTENYYVVIRNGEVFSDGLGFWYVRYPKQDDYGIFAEINSDGHSFSFYNSGSSNTNYSNGRLSITYDGQVYHNVYSQNPFTNFWNVESSLYSSSYSYISNFKIYSNNNPDTQVVVLRYGPDDDGPVGTGHATPPGEFVNPTLANGSNHTLPREVPETPTINNYTWITYNPPNIDTTNMESLLESLIYVINYLAGWLRDNLSGEFQNLISNLQDLFDFVVDTIQYYIGLVISNIQNGIDTFYNNMVSLFEPIAAKVDYITSPIDSDIIDDAFTSTNFYTIKTQFTSVFTTFDNAFDIAEPDSFTIIFNVQNITLFYDFGVRSPVTVDLGANFLPIRAALRTFLWVLVSFGSVFVVEHGLSNWIRGERNT